MNYFKQKNVIEGVVSFKKRIQINTNVKVYLIPYDSITNWYSDYQLDKIRDEALEEITSYAQANNLSFIEIIRDRNGHIHSQRHTVQSGSFQDTQFLTSMVEVVPICQDGIL